MYNPKPKACGQCGYEDFVYRKVRVHGFNYDNESNVWVCCRCGLVYLPLKQTEKIKVLLI
jgi:uncharacterized Zn finger protein